MCWGFGRQKESEIERRELSCLQLQEVREKEIRIEAKMIS